MTTQSTIQPDYQVIHWNGPTEGGSFLAAWATHQALREHGVTSRLQVHRGPVPELPDVDYLNLGLHFRPQGLLRKIRLGYTNPRTWNSTRKPPKNPILPGWEFHRPFLSAPTSPPEAVLTQPRTILHLHWVVGMVDYPSFFAKLPADTPVVWTCHDSAPFTGGCYHPAGCTNFQNACGDCHFLSNPGPQDASAHNHRMKMDAIGHLRNLHVVGVSRWMTEQASKSSLFAHARSVRTIHNLIDFEIFQSVPKHLARSLLGLPQDVPIVLSGAHYAKNWRKGQDLLLEALEHLELPATAQSPMFISFGLYKGRNEKVRGFLHRHFGYITVPGFMALLHNAADVLVMPSREEAFGLIALEAAACGTPVIAFRTGGLPDIIDHEVTGLLAEPEDALSLRDNLQRLLTDPESARRWGEAAARISRERFHAEKHWNEYDQVYREALSPEMLP